MAITLQQTGRTTTSVTFAISGVTDDRQTYIWIPMLSQSNRWITLSDAYSLGYVRSYSSTDDRNGSLTVNFYSYDAAEYKVWEFYVYNLSDGSATAGSNMLDTILKFEFDNYATKNEGGNIDITLNDMQQINLFGSYIDSWINNGDGTYYPLNDVKIGDSIFAVYMSLPAQNIYNAAYSFSSSYLPNRSTILSNTKNIVDNVYSGADFKASYFNYIKDAINNFNIRC